MITRFFARLFLFLAAVFATTPSYAPDNVTLQLKWKHAFQFAGYYMAKEKGFFREAGLDVDIVEAESHADPVQIVLSDDAQFAVGSSSLLLNRAKGEPVIALAVIFQQSPYAIFAAPDIQNIHDLVGKRIMLEPQSDELLAYLRKEGISLESLHLIPHSYDAEGLMSGKADAISGYSSNEPFYFKKAHYSFQTFSPRSAGIDFYGDNLFTSEQELRAHPERVKAFRAASLRGWQYVKTHRDETIDLILEKYAPRLSREYLDFEANQMLPLLQPNLIEIGYMNPHRWDDIARTYADLGLVPQDFSLDGFLYDATEPDYEKFYIGFAILLALVGVVVSIAIYIIRTNVKLRKSEEKYRLLTENAKEVVWTLCPRTLRFLYVSPAVFNLRGYTSDEVMAEPLDAALTKEGSAFIRASIQQDLSDIESGKRSIDVFRTDEVEQPCKEGSMIWTEVVTNYYLNKRTHLYEIRGVTRDITQRKKMEVEIHQLAFFDSLTKLPNRRMLTDRLSQAMAASKRSSCYGALMLLDLDNFKALNDTHGHAAGDLLLITAANRLKSCVREIDTVARFGGDEFVVILSELDADKTAAIAHARLVAEKILAALSAPYILAVTPEKAPGSTIEHHCTASIGIAMFINHEGSQDDILKQADTAMYQAKDAGRNSIRLYKPEDGAAV